MTTIGILGSGALGSNVARALASAGVSAMIANSRGPQSLQALTDETGPLIKAVTAEEAASADVVLIALRWSALPEVLSTLPAWNNRIVIDGTNAVEFLDPQSPDATDPSNPLAAYGIKAIDLGDKHSSEVVRGLVPGARLVKALNHLDVQVLTQPEVAGGQRVQFYSGDDADAKGVVRGILESAGYFPVDLGALDVGGRLATLPFGSLAAINFVRIP
ncbi:NADPH-dependent F420 reductase [Pseudomonas viridiflava]|uniref:NADPH-dependent F420 reductase n=2 Tax=Pseudomonas viridiflava TaxID=33069 RepID=UPI000BBD5BB1|nr:NAD(P)-binding domain-containing protein [Pseudomonas viridiflava]MEE4088305.1 NAD(P)-binding domain-containing protein [Pseudomonas viridiflava]MEE4159834.1 NAD(P)-binding domain-containing protein [Pseudomonas viridiflava]PCK91374.1 NADP oxidoreductase [Pseudomonas viridiflava]